MSFTTIKPLVLRFKEEKKNRTRVFLPAIVLPADIHAYEDHDNSLDKRIDAKLLFIDEDKKLYVIEVSNNDDNNKDSNNKDNNKDSKDSKSNKDSKDSKDKLETSNGKDRLTTSNGKDNKNKKDDDYNSYSENYGESKIKMFMINSVEDYKIRKSTNDGWFAWKLNYNNLPLSTQLLEQNLFPDLYGLESDTEIVSGGFINTLSINNFTSFLIPPKLSPASYTLSSSSTSPASYTLSPESFTLSPESFTSSISLPTSPVSSAVFPAPTPKFPAPLPESSTSLPESSICTLTLPILPSLSLEENCNTSQESPRSIEIEKTDIPILELPN